MVVRAVLAVLALVAFGQVARQIHAFDAPVQIHFDSFQLDRRYADIAIVGEIFVNKTLFFQGGSSCASCDSICAILSIVDIISQFRL
jgi:hypothetical protein